MTLFLQILARLLGPCIYHCQDSGYVPLRHVPLAQPLLPCTSMLQVLSPTCHHLRYQVCPVALRPKPPQCTSPAVPAPVLPPCKFSGLLVHWASEAAHLPVSFLPNVPLAHCTKIGGWHGAAAWRSKAQILGTAAAGCEHIQDPGPALLRISGPKAHHALNGLANATAHALTAVARVRLGHSERHTNAVAAAQLAWLGLA